MYPAFGSPVEPPDGNANALPQKDYTYMNARRGQKVNGLQREILQIEAL